MTVVEAEEKLLTILKQVMEEKLTSSNVEVLHYSRFTHPHLECGLIFSLKLSYITCKEFTLLEFDNSL